MPRVLELTYTAWDLKPFAEDLGYEGPPFTWDEAHRAILRAELDAYYASLYGLTRDELRYILDPSDVYGPDFPGETFRVLKNNDIKRYGEFRTQRLVLEAWDRLGLAPRNRDGRYEVEPRIASTAPSGPIKVPTLPAPSRPAAATPTQTRPATPTMAASTQTALESNDGRPTPALPGRAQPRAEKHGELAPGVNVKQSPAWPDPSHAGDTTGCVPALCQR